MKNMNSVSHYTARNNLCLDLNAFTVSEFINFIYAYYKTDLPSELDIYFIGDCEFRISILVRWIFISLKTEHQAMMNLLDLYPKSMQMDLTYAYYNSENRIFQIDDFQIIRDIWKLHANFKRIEISSHNVTFLRFAPVQLQRLCLFLVDAEDPATLPTHVLKRLKHDAGDADSFEYEEAHRDAEIGKCFRLLRWEGRHLVYRN